MITKNPDNPAYHNEKGDVLSILGKNFTMDDNLILRLGVCFLDNSKRVREVSDSMKVSLKIFDNAIKEYNIAIKLDPKNALYHKNKASLLNFIGTLLDPGITCSSDIYTDQETSPKKYQEAIEEYDKALEIDPNNINLCIEKGDSLYNLKKYDLAIEEYDKVLKINQNDPGAHFQRGRVLSKLKKYKEAIEEYNKVLELDPKDSHAHNNKGTSLDELGDIDGALKEYDKALAITPNLVSAHYNKGNIFLKTQKYQEAIEEYDQAIKTDPNYAAAHFNKSIALKKLGKNEESDQEFNIVANINYCLILKNQIVKKS
jgi:tetratricopeptide (TPR) repeat protein